MFMKPVRVTEIPLQTTAGFLGFVGLDRDGIGERN